MTNQLRIRVAEAMGTLCDPPGHHGAYSVPKEICVQYSPAYDTDANAALLLVARLKEQGWAFHAELDGGHWLVHFLHPTTCRGSQSEDAPTFAEAICLAFIKATQGETKL